MRFRWASLGVCVLGAFAAAIPAWGAPTVRMSIHTQIAQAVVTFGDSCAVIVNVTEETRRQLGRGETSEAPAATLYVHHFCADSSGSASRTLTSGEYGFAHDTAYVTAAVGVWHVALDWTATGEPQTIVTKTETDRTVARDSPATVAGSITDGVTTASGEATVMADVASLHTMRAAS